jgi:hypothetical protein
LVKVLNMVADASAGGSVRQVLAREGDPAAAILSCYDDFTFGPLRNVSPPEKLIRLRHRHWLALPGFDPVEATATARAPLSADLRDSITCAERIDVFLGGTGREQLFLLALSHMLDACNFDPGAVRVFQYPREEPWRSLGGYSLDEVANRPRPITLTSALMARLETLWAAVCDSTPHALFALRALGPSMPEFPFVHRALDDLARSYPKAKNGLNEADERLLGAAKLTWTKAAMIVAKSMSRTNERSFGDGILFGRLLELANASNPSPVVELQGAGRNMRRCEFRLTDFGAACRSGHANLVATNGIDRWVGGVHLHSGSQRVWYRDADERLVVDN